MFLSKARAYLSEHLLGKLLALPTNIGPDLLETNVPAYLAFSSITMEKGFEALTCDYDPCSIILQCSTDNRKQWVLDSSAGKQQS